MGVKNWSSRDSWSTLKSIAFAGSAVIVYILNNGIFTKSNSSTTGSNIPDWRRFIKLGLQATTTLNVNVFTVTKRKTTANASWLSLPKDPPLPDDAPISWNIDSRGSDVGFPTQGLPKDNGNPAPLQTADYQALVNFMSNVRSTQTSFQGGVFLGEIRETVHLLKHPAQSLRKGLSSYLATLKKRKRLASRLPPKSRGKLLMDIASDTWLEYAFGWKPLVHDINDAAKTLENHVARLHGPIDKFVIGSSVYETIDQGGSYAYSISNGPLQISFNVQHRFRHYVKYYGKVALENPGQVSWKMAGFSLDNFVPTVWELIPWSFLVDYFTNIGDIINCATTSTSSLKWCSRTSIEEEINKVTAASAKSDLRYYDGQFIPSTAVSFTPGETVFSYKRIARAPYNGPYVPPLVFKRPGDQSTRWINIAALFSAHKGVKPYR